MEKQDLSVKKLPEFYKELKKAYIISQKALEAIYHNTLGTRGFDEFLETIDIISTKDLYVGHGFSILPKQTLSIDYKPVLETMIEEGYPVEKKLAPEAVEDYREFQEYVLKKEKIHLYVQDGYRTQFEQAILPIYPALSTIGHGIIYKALNVNREYSIEEECQKLKKKIAPYNMSEHTTGLAMDLWKIEGGKVVPLTEADYLKVAIRAKEMKLFLRYPAEKETITHYQEELWHYRVLSKRLAAFLYEHNLSLEEFYALSLPFLSEEAKEKVNIKVKK